MQLGSLEELEYEDLKKTSTEAVSLLDEAFRISRTLTADLLSPPVLHNAGLKAGLQWLSRWMLDKHGLQVELSTEADPRSLAEDVRVFLFEAARELLFNAVKHAKTASARVGLDVVGEELRLYVSDHGFGFDP